MEEKKITHKQIEFDDDLHLYLTATGNGKCYGAQLVFTGDQRNYEYFRETGNSFIRQMAMTLKNKDIISE